ncbi:MAG: DUF2971 domain-containing protein [Clostridia bacterium]|nr:DUF2971 domain-containing protein [Clostridia bacterium]
MEFYDEYFSLPNSLISKGDNERIKYKEEYIRKKANDNYIYKFIPFTDDIELNESKINLLAKKELWASCYAYFSDKSETQYNYNINRVNRKTRISIKAIRNMILTSKEMNDVSCFTYEKCERMWTEYANGYNGICLKFALLDMDKFFPVIYLDKEKVDFTGQLIGAYNSTSIEKKSNYSEKLAILPWVMKNKTYKWENELRFLCGDVYDSEDGPMGGRILAGKKALMGYRGTTYSYDYCGIKLEEIIIGKNCDKEYLRRIKMIEKEICG